MAKPYEIKASIVIEATPVKVHEILNDLARLDDWSPYSAMDKAIKTSVSTPASGIGAKYEWTSKKVGNGNMEIISSGPQRIRAKMTFLNGKKTDTAMTEYLLEPTFEGTKVTWTMAGERGTFGQVMNAVIQMDKMMTKSFNDGLKVLKAIVE